MSAAQLFLPASRAFNSNGLPVAGAVLKLYTTGTLVPQPMYSDSALTISLGSSVTANAAGRFDTIYQDNATPFRLRIEDASGAELDDIDPFYFGQMDVSLDTIYPAALGTLADMPTTSIPTGIDIVSTTGADVLDHGGGTYVAGAAPAARAGFTSANSRAFVLSREQIITPQMFYQATDPNFGTATLAAIEYLKAIATSGYGYGNLGAPKLVFPAGVYDLGTTTIDLDFGIIIEGESVGGVGPGSTVLKWTNGTTGIRTQYNDTTGATGTKTPVSNYGICSLRNLLLFGSYTSGAESEAYGIHARSHISVEDVGIYNFAGDGVYQHNTAGGSPEGNSNISFFKNVFVQGCRNGFYADGADTNASTFIACNAIANRQWGFWDSSFIGNSYIGCHAAANGWDGAITSTPTGSTLNSLRFYIKPGQATGASTNTPKSSTVTITIASPGVVTWNAHGLSDGAVVMLNTTGALPTGLSAGTKYFVSSSTTNTFLLTTTPGAAAVNTSGSQSGTHTAGADNAYWGVNSIGGTYNGIVAWVSGTTFREGGSYKADEASAVNQFFGCYSEADQNPPQIAAPSITWGGVVGITNKGTGPTVGVSGADLQLLGGGLLTNGGNAAFGSAAGSDLSIYSNIGIGATFAASVHSQFFIAGARVFDVASNGINLDSGKVLAVNTNQVVGARDTGWAADTGTAKRTANATYAAGSTLTYSAAYVQAEQTAMATRVAALEVVIQANSQTIKALKDMVLAHGLAGA